MMTTTPQPLALDLARIAEAVGYRSLDRSVWA